MKRGLIAFLCCLSWFLVTQDIHAESVNMDQVLVTATRTEVQKSKVPASVTIITRKDIAESRVPTVQELLREVAGLDVTQQGGPGKNTTVFIRGAESRHTLVLIDGIKVNSPTTGGYDFADLSVDDIERIEIIRSPLSTLYGSDAIGGVIQIITRRAETTSAKVSFETGSYGTFRENVSTDLKKEKYDLSLTASRFDTEGFSAVKAGTERDGYQSTSVSSRLGIYRGGGTKLDFTARLTESNTELDGFNADDINYQQQRRWSVFGFTRSSVVTDSWDQKLSLSHSQDRLNTRDDDDPGNRYVIDMGITTIDWQNNIQGIEGNLLTLGYEWQDKKGENQGSTGTFNKSYSNNAIYLQEQQGFNTPFQVLAGLRWDDSTIYKSAITYRLGLSYLAAEGVKWHFQYGTGFMGPTLNDLFWPESTSYGTTLAGNPDLKPEESRGWEVGVEQSLSDKMSIELNYYDNVYKELIQWYFDTSTLKYQPRNLAEASSKGIDTNLQWRLSEMIRIGGTYSYNDTEDNATHSYLLKRPLNKYTFYLQLNPDGRWQAAMNFLHVGRRFDWDSDFDGKPDVMSAYSRIDIIGSYKISGITELFGRIDNLLDKEYEEAKGYNTAGFSTYAGLKMNF